MSGFIILQDGRAWTRQNSIFDTVIEHIAEALAAMEEGQLLAEWLLNQRTLILGPGLGRVDIRELTPRNQALLIAACRQGFLLAKQRARQHSEEQKQAFDEGRLENATTLSWLLETYALLLLMIESVEKGEPPEVLNPYLYEPLKPTRARSGPGWK